MKDKIKQTIRKYAPLVLLAGSLAVVGCKNNEDYLPINQEVKERVLSKQEQYSFKEKQKYITSLDSLVVEAEKNVFDARELFNKGIEKGSLDKLTMEQTLSKYEKANSLYSMIKSIARKEHIEKYVNISMEKGDRNLMNKHNESLYGLDGGKAELQKDLEKQGLEIKVYNEVSSLDWLAILVGAIGSVLLLGGLTDLLKKGCYKINKNKKK